MHRPRYNNIACLMVTVLAVSLAGCSIRRSQPPELLWPEPPLTPRIKFVGLLRNQKDLGRNVGELFAEALVGPQPASDSIQRPMAVAPSRDGKRLYVSDYDQGRVVEFDFETRKMRTLGDEGHSFVKPFGVAVDDAGRVYVVDSSARLVRVFNAQNQFITNIQPAQFERPTGIAVDSSRRRIYVVDSSRKESANHVVHVLDLDGNYLNAVGGLGTEEGKFYFPTYVTVDREGRLYVADSLNSRVQVFDSEGNYLRTVGAPGDTFGGFHKPKGVAVDSFGNTYVVDSVWSNVQIFNRNGDVLLYFAGRGGIPGLLNNPTGIAIDASNRIYVADAFNGRVAMYQLINTKAEDSFLTPEAANEKGGAETRIGRSTGNDSN